MDINLIRNFAIIAHIDHGKSTLADRLIEFTGSVNKRLMKAQFLDKMDIERERGITIKAQTIMLKYTADNHNNYVLNLIDTPGHIDFAYEVSRSLAACEGVLLVIDASQGVEAQTIANAYLAIDQNLNIIPVINKIDLPSADPERVKKEIEDTIGIDAKDAICASAKTGIGTKEILESIVEKIAPPQGDHKSPLKALVIDSWYDDYRGIIVLVRVVDGSIKTGDNIIFISTSMKYIVHKTGVYNPTPIDKDSLSAGEVGFISAGIKSLKDIKIGDTITKPENPTKDPFPDFKNIKPVVFCGFYPVDPNDFETLKIALEKLSLNDSSFTFEFENSNSLGFGFRSGFLGLLHMEITQERLEREFMLNMIMTAPTVNYKIYKKNGGSIDIDNPTKFPNMGDIEKIEEPYINATIIVPGEYIGKIIQLLQKRRGIQKDINYIQGDRVILEYKMPLTEIVVDFYDKLMSISKGYASFDYEHSGYKSADMVKLDILLNSEPVDALSVIVHRETANYKGRELVKKIKEVIPRQMFDIAIQAAIGSKILARSSVKAFRKNVTSKCYGGDITRKRKLLEKQKEGKKRMKQIGSVEVPQEAFLSILKISED